MSANPYGLDWFVLRVAISEATRVPIPEARRWAFADLLDAHLVLDLIDAEREAAVAAAKESR